nr:energy transducer TonB [Fulvivirga aurantia]
MLSLVVVILLFEWKTYDKQELVEIVQAGATTESLIEIPLTKQPPPPPNKIVQQPNIIEVSEEQLVEDITVDFDVEITEEEAISYEEPVAIEMEEPVEEVAEEIFTIVEDPPAPEGGLQAFFKYVGEEINYPAGARRLGIEGKVFVQFVVNTDGSLTDVVVIKGIGGGCDEEAIRVIKNAPHWAPGKQRGQPVRVRMMIPIFFTLG